MASGTIVKNVVEYIVNQIVEDTKSVKVDVADSDDENVTIEVRTSPDDMGRVIGKRGRSEEHTSEPPVTQWSRMPSSAWKKKKHTNKISIITIKLLHTDQK